ncbi:hypothetical protein MPER_04036 [Moniliophthora perniciosa FA553]|nr:hypothetical protein MPER_04036 [Moniliophthora perniciosa FA553]
MTSTIPRSHSKEQALLSTLGSEQYEIPKRVLGHIRCAVHVCDADTVKKRPQGLDRDHHAARLHIPFRVINGPLGHFRGFFLKYPDLSLGDRIARVNIEKTKLWFPEETLFLFNMIVGDGVVIWRAWVLCKNTRLQKLVYVPNVTGMAAFVESRVHLSGPF